MLTSAKKVENCENFAIFEKCNVAFMLRTKYQDLNPVFIKT